MEKIIKQYFEFSKLEKFKTSMYVLMLFTLPLTTQFSKLSIFSLMVIFIFEKNFSKRFLELKKHKWLIISAIIYFIILLFSVFYSENINKGFLRIFTKLPILIFCIIIVSDKLFLSRIGIILFKTFLIGLTISVFFLYGVAFYRFLLNGFSPILVSPIDNSTLNLFYYQKFSQFYHPTYHSLLALFGAVLLYSEYGKESINNILRILLILFYCITVLLLSSKAAILSLIIAILILAYAAFKNKFGHIKSLIFTLILSFCLVFVILKNERFQTFMYYLKHESTSINENSPLYRFMLQKHAIILGSESFVKGFGIGDYTEDLNHYFEVNKISSSTIFSGDPHNEFITAYLSAGFLGFLFFIAIFFELCRDNWKAKNINGLVLLIIVMFNMLFESLLSKSIGVISVFLIIPLATYVFILTFEQEKKQYDNNS